MSRGRSRVAAVVAVVPLALAGGPLVAPAYAAGEYQVANLITPGQTVGPNTGYLGLGVGQTGTTAMFKVTPPSGSATITSVGLTLTQLDNPGTYIYQNELDTTDGLSLYADVNDNGSFDAADKETGLRSNGFRAGRVQSNGDIPFLVTLGAPASGDDFYFVAIHPAATAVTGRRFTFKLNPGDIVGSAGDGPAAAVSTPAQEGDTDPRMVVDATAPATPARSVFTPDNNVPGEEDTYAVPPTVAGGDSTTKIAFYNAETTIAPTALLTRIGFDKTVPATAQLGKVAFENVVDPANPTEANVVPIGDGSGLFHGVAGFANNNQVNNAVYARLIDSSGNVSAPVVLSDCFIAPNTSGCEPAKGNPVIGPETPTSAELGSTVGTKIVAINGVNEAAVPVAVGTSNGAITAPTSRTAADTTSRAIAARARVVQLTGAGLVDADYGTANKETNYSSTSALFTGVNAFDTTVKSAVPKGVQEGLGIASAYAVSLDRAGNPSQPKMSATAYKKDITAPTGTVRSTITNPGPGDEVTVVFSEPMDPATITTARAETANEVTGLCATNTSDDSVDKVLDVVDNTTGNDRSWGYGACYDWNTDNTVGTITLGEAPSYPACQVPGTTCLPLPSVDDLVKYGSGNSALTDSAGNPIFGEGTAPYRTPIIVPPAMPDLLETRDGNLDGKLDGIYVEFTAPLNMTTVNNSLANFTVVGATTVPVTSATMQSGDASKILFAFTSDFGTGDVPTLRLSAPVGQTSTGVLDSPSGRQVEPFSRTPVDKAKPQPVSALTVDDSNPKDGRIDKVTVTYSESIVHAQDNNPAQTNLTGAAYNVAGYTPAAPAPNSEPRNPATPTTGTGSVKTLALTRPNTNLDSAARPLVKFTSFNDVTGYYAPTDPVDNAWNPDNSPNPSVFTLVPNDGVGPAYASRHTRDLDADGKVDAIDLKFSENIPTIATGAAFTVTGHQILDQFGLGTDGIRIVIDETAPSTGDTAPNMTPTIQHNGGVQDSFGNPMPNDAAPVTTTDGAGPAIMGACPSSPKGSNGTCPEDDPAVATDDGAKMNVFFSEPLNAGTVAATDFVVEQPAGTTAKTISGAPVVTNATDGKSSTVALSFAQGTLLNTLDSVVRLAAAEAVDDSSGVKSSQTSNVTAFAPPTVELALTCPVAAKDGFCSVTTVNTGLSSSAGVTKWRLKNTARGTTVDPADYTTTPPATVTLVEGSHTLYLTGSDNYGRLSPEVSDTIYVLTAPKIQEFQLTNSGRRPANVPTTGDWSKISTYLDGDRINFGANAYGTDAADWASGPVGGGCEAAHMTMNLNKLTGRSGDANAAPTSCNLITTGAQPYRQMQWNGVTVAGTTKYPVGTVLRTSTSDPGSMVVDGPAGTQRRRQFISVNARRSWMVSDASVITVPSALVAAIPRTTNLGYRDGAILRTGSTYYYVHMGVKRPVSTAQLSAWRISTATAYAPTSTELRAIPTGTRIASATHQIGTWIKYSNGQIFQIVRKSNGATVRRQLAAGAALRTRVPSSHVYPALSTDSKLPVDSWLIGYRDGTLLKMGTTTYGVAARGSIRKFANPEAFNALGYSTSSALPFSGSGTSRVRGASYRLGTDIDRYEITGLLMKVTNSADAVVTLTVHPAYGKVWGVGTPDPMPAGWDTSR